MAHSHLKFERPSHCAESAPSRRRVQISSVAGSNRSRVGQLNNLKTALAARSPLHAPAAPSYAGWAAGSGASCKGRASASPLAMAGIFIAQSRAPLPNGLLKAGRFQALPLARSVLSRELRRKGPVRCESQRGLTTSETCRVPNPVLQSEYLHQHSTHGRTSPRGEPCPQYSGRRRACAGPRRPSPIDQAA
jgi:hypothetical protein